MNSDTIKVENEESSDAPSSTTTAAGKVQRPRRAAVRAAEFNSGLLWTEEKELKKALYASLQDTRMKVKSASECDDSTEGGATAAASAAVGQRCSSRKRAGDAHLRHGAQSGENPANSKRAKVHAQRKFAQGSNPTSPSVTPVKLKNSVSPAVELITARKPKTEDFLTFLCFRGTSILPPALNYFNSAPSANDLLCDGQLPTFANGDSQRSKAIPKPLALRGGIRVAPKPPPGKTSKPKVAPARKVVRPPTTTATSASRTLHRSCSSGSSSADTDDEPVAKKNATTSDSSRKKSCGGAWSNREGILAQLDLSVHSNVGASSAQMRGMHGLKQKYRQQRLAKHREALTKAAKKTEPVASGKRIATASSPVPRPARSVVAESPPPRRRLVEPTDAGRVGRVLTRLQEQVRSNGAAASVQARPSTPRRAPSTSVRPAPRAVETRRPSSISARRASSENAGDESKPVTRNAAALLLKTSAPKSSSSKTSERNSVNVRSDREESGRTGRERRGVRSGTRSEGAADSEHGSVTSPLPEDHSYVRRPDGEDCASGSPPPKLERRTRSHVATSDFSSDDDEPLIKRGLRTTTTTTIATSSVAKSSNSARKTATVSVASSKDAGHRMLAAAGERRIPTLPRPATRQTREVVNLVVCLELLDQKFASQQPATTTASPAVARNSAAVAPPAQLQPPFVSTLKEVNRRDAKVMVVPVDATKKKGRRCASDIILDTSTISTSSSGSTTTGSSTSPGTSPNQPLTPCPRGSRRAAEMLKRTSTVKTRDFTKKMDEAQFKLAQAQGEKGKGQATSRGAAVRANEASLRHFQPPPPPPPVLKSATLSKSAGRTTAATIPIAGFYRALTQPAATPVQPPKVAGSDRLGGAGSTFPKPAIPPKAAAISSAAKGRASTTKQPPTVDTRRPSSKPGHQSKNGCKSSTVAPGSEVSVPVRPKAKRGPPVRKNVIRESDRKSARTKLFATSGHLSAPSDKMGRGARRAHDLERRLSTSSSSLSSTTSSSSSASTTSSSSSSGSSSSSVTIPVTSSAATFPTGVGPSGKAGASGVVVSDASSSSSTATTTTTSSASTSSESSTSAEDAPSKPESTTISVRQNVASTSVAVQIDEANLFKVNLINDISDLDEDEEFWEPGMIEGGETMEDFFVGGGGIDRVLTPTLCKGYSPNTTPGLRGSGGRSSWEQESPPTPLVLKMAASRSGGGGGGGGGSSDISSAGRQRSTPTRPQSKSSTPATPSPLTINNKKPKPCSTSDDESGDANMSCGLTTGVREAPVFHPTAEEFQDPLQYIEKIRPEAEEFGVCMIVPPASFKPECKVADDMRFTAHNQYVHKVFNRSGPNVQEMDVIRKHLEIQGVEFDQPPLIGGMELDLPRLLRTVQQLGGPQEVMEKKKWKKVADLMKIAKSAQDRATKLYDAYCKYLLSYDTLSKEEKNKLEQLVRAESQRSKGQEDDVEISECVTKGRSMSLSSFYRIARNTMAMWFRGEPKPLEVEQEYWRQVTQRQNHICVNAGNIDSSTYGYGFSCNKSSPSSRHPWNLKVLTNNPKSILRCLGPVLGVTIPTLHVGMLFTTGCWYRDPHCLPWIEYLHTGASKIWYGVPASQSCQFRDAMGKIVPYCCTNNPIWVPSDTAMVPPNLLVDNGVSLCRLVQNSGQYVVVFPRAFTSTLCCGYSVSESVYFATPDWLEIAPIAFKEIVDSCEPAVFSLKRLLVGIAVDGTVGPEVLRQILPLLKEIRDYELTLRKQLCDLGLNELEHIPLCEVKDTKKRASRSPNEQEHECDVCRENCYISMVINTQNDVSYCLRHAVDHLHRRKKDIKSCKLLFMYSEAQLNELVQKTGEQLDAHCDRKRIVAKKPSSKKTT